MNHLDCEIARADADETIEIRTGYAPTGSISVQELVETQLDHLVLFTLESVYAAEKVHTLLPEFRCETESPIVRRTGGGLSSETREPILCPWT